MQLLEKSKLVTIQRILNNYSVCVIENASFIWLSHWELLAFPILSYKVLEINLFKYSLICWFLYSTFLILELKQLNKKIKNWLQFSENNRLMTLDNYSVDVFENACFINICHWKLLAFTICFMKF